MTGLEDVFGEDFVQEYNKKVAQKREERQAVSEESMAEIANLAVNEGKFKDGNPQFQYVTDSDVTHDVLLMQLPNVEGRSIFSYANELDSGAVTCPLDYMGEWMSCLFNDPEDLKQMEPGEHYIIIGELDQWENDKGEVNDQVSPVRGVLTLQEAKEMAGSRITEDVNDSPDITEDASADDDDDEDEEDSDGSFLSGDSDDEEEEDTLDESDVHDIVDVIAEKEPEVWDVEEDSDRHDRLSQVVAKRLDGDYEADDVSDIIIDYIESQTEEEEDEDDEDDLLF